MPKEDLRGYLHQLVDHLKNAFAAIKTTSGNGGVKKVFEGKEWSMGSTYTKNTSGVNTSYLQDHTVFIAHLGSSEWPVVCVKTGVLIVGSLSMLVGATMHTYTVRITYDPIKESITLKSSMCDNDTVEDVVALYAVI